MNGILFSKYLIHKCPPESTFDWSLLGSQGECKILFPVSGFCSNAAHLCLDRGIIWHCNAL